MPINVYSNTIDTQKINYGRIGMFPIPKDFLSISGSHQLLYGDKEDGYKVIVEWDNCDELIIDVGDLEGIIQQYKAIESGLAEPVVG